MKINIITAIPEYFASVLGTSMLARAVKAGVVSFEILCLRDFADGNRKKVVDDAPYGGGPGMILKIEPIVRALRFLESKKQKGQVFLTSAAGQKFDQCMATKFTQIDTFTLICGHYEGVDARIAHYVDAEISIGNFVLTGGEPAAAVIVDATVRLLPGVLGNSASLAEESYTGNFLEYPQYTRPEEFEGHRVPAVLLSGNHEAIADWRASMSGRLNEKP